MSEDRTYYIVNKHGIIYEVTREHAAWRLQQQGFRVPTAAELKEYLVRREQGNKRRMANPKAKPFMQTANNSIAEAFEPDPDEAMSKIEREMSKVEKYLPQVVNATDGAIEFAEEFGLDLNEIAGSGSKGKVIKADVMAHLEGDALEVDEPEDDQPEVDDTEVEDDAE